MDLITNLIYYYEFEIAWVEIFVPLIYENEKKAVVVNFKY